MTRVGFASATLLALLARATAIAAQSPPADTLAIEHVTVLPMNRDTALADHTVLVARDRIVWVGPARGARVPAGARRVEWRGRFIVPGLADMHVHLEEVGDLAQYVAAGVTTVSNMNGRPEHLTWRDRVARGTLVGPRIYTAGRAISRSPFGLQRHGPRNVAAAEAFVLEQRRAGYDLIKVQNGITLPVYRRLLEVARAARIPVVGHVAPDVGVAHSLAAGQVTFEHAELPMFDGGEARLDEGARAIA